MSSSSITSSKPKIIELVQKDNVFLVSDSVSLEVGVLLNSDRVFLESESSPVSGVFLLEAEVWLDEAGVWLGEAGVGLDEAGVRLYVAGLGLEED